MAMSMIRGYLSRLMKICSAGAKQDTRADIIKARASAKKEGRSLDKTYDLRSINLSDHYQIDVYDQGNIGSCTANALCAAYKMCMIKQKDFSGFNPSRLFLYYNTRKRTNATGKDNGAPICNAIMAFNCEGVCDEKDWPYHTWKIYREPPKKCYDSARGNNLCEFYRLEQDINQFRACLMIDKCPFVFTLKLYESTRQFDNSGILSIPDIYNDRHDRHTVMAVGYDDDQRHIIVLNSWGEGWGHGGYFHVPYDLIEDPNMCLNFWKISFACTPGNPYSM